MGNIFTDVKTAIKLTGEARKARKAGASGIQVRPVYTLPHALPAPAYFNTIEGCITWELGREIDWAVARCFKSLPCETQRRLEHSPQTKLEWAARARFWKEQLQPTLPPPQYHKTLALFIGWYAHCLRMGT